MLPSLDIIIVNWNTSNQLLECLNSIGDNNYDTFKLNRLVVVDNASSDRSLEEVDKVDLPLTVIYNSNNRGFGSACNQGAKNSNADYILFLNPDTKLYSDSLKKPINFMQQDENKTIGICGIKLIGEKDVQRSCARFPSPSILISSSLGLDKLFPQLIPSHSMLEFDHESSRSVDQVIGAFFLIRRGLFEELNGFDERFFVYFEEVDLSLRAKQKGWSSFYFADAMAFHRGGGSSEQVKAHRLFYSLRSRILYAFKHFLFSQAWFMVLIATLVEPFTRIFYSLLRGKLSEVWSIIVGYFYFFRAIPEILAKIR